MHLKLQVSKTLSPLQSCPFQGVGICSPNILLLMKKYVGSVFLCPPPPFLPYIQFRSKACKFYFQNKTWAHLLLSISTATILVQSTTLPRASTIHSLHSNKCDFFQLRIGLYYLPASNTPVTSHHTLNKIELLTKAARHGMLWGPLLSDLIPLLTVPRHPCLLPIPWTPHVCIGLRASASVLFPSGMPESPLSAYLAWITFQLKCHSLKKDPALEKA